MGLSSSSFWYQSLGVVSPKDKKQQCAQRALATRLRLIKLMSGLGHELNCARKMEMLCREGSITVNRFLEKSIMCLGRLRWNVSVIKLFCLWHVTGQSPRQYPGFHGYLLPAWGHHCEEDSQSHGFHGAKIQWIQTAVLPLLFNNVNNNNKKSPSEWCFSRHPGCLKMNFNFTALVIPTQCSPVWDSIVTRGREGWGGDNKQVDSRTSSS